MFHSNFKYSRTCSNRYHTTSDSFCARDNTTAHSLPYKTIDIRSHNSFKIKFATDLCSLNHSGADCLGGISHNVDTAWHGLAEGSEGAPCHTLLSLGCTGSRCSWVGCSCICTIVAVSLLFLILFGVSTGRVVNSWTSLQRFAARLLRWGASLS